MQNKGASLDSELSLVKVKDYPLLMWQTNPLFVGKTSSSATVLKNDVIMVSRLDGPTPEIVYRLINDSIYAEKKGLTGNACFDARWQRSDKADLKNYKYYDQSIHQAADSVLKKTGLSVVMENTSDLLQKGDCPETVFYCGWYSLGKYVDAFSWKKGAIGYHIASAECTTLKKKNSTVWCKRMLEEGIAVTIGPVGEPYVGGFPEPEIFFRSLIIDKKPVVEAYYRSLPWLSWKMVLIGDPLYRPNVK